MPAGTPRSQDDGASGVTPINLPCAQPGELCPKTLDVNLAQLTVGLAWHYKEFAKEQSEEDRHRYAFAEQEARARRAGPALELVRLTMPRRVSTPAHTDLTAESVIAVHDERRSARGLKIVYETSYRRFFQARFARP